MEFESVEQTAKRLQVTTRTIQKWAKAGKIPGVRQMGRTWLIPLDFSGVIGVKEIINDDGITGDPLQPLFAAVFEPGHCWEYVQSYPEGVRRDVMSSQYYYLIGQPDKAVELAAPYLNHEDTTAALLASITYCFASVSLGKPHLYRIGKEHAHKYVQLCLRTSQDPQVRAYMIYIANMEYTLRHVPCPPMPALASEMKHLPMGVRLHAAYVVAHEAYLEKDYARCLGMVEMALAMCGDTYVIPAIYLHLMASIAYMNQRRTLEARSEFELAWQLARADGFNTIFSEHIGILQGLLEVCLKKNYPQEYAVLLHKATIFAEGWLKIHNEKAERTVADQLTAIELAVATLFQKGWSVKEIAAYMEISPRMVRHHISVVYEKLGITHREELAAYLVR